jgi:hypothetical protein
MALIVEDGSGKSDAESYLSVADADTYFTNRGGNATWTAASTANKEAALRIATQYLDAAYSGRWRGIHKLGTQRLAWPRAYVEDDDGYAIDSDDLPRNLEEATAEAALRHMTEDDGLMPDLDQADVKRYAVKVGPITEDTTYLGAEQLKRFSLIDALLSSILEPPGVARG